MWQEIYYEHSFGAILVQVCKKQTNKQTNNQTTIKAILRKSMLVICTHIQSRA